MNDTLKTGLVFDFLLAHSMSFFEIESQLSRDSVIKVFAFLTEQSSAVSSSSKSVSLKNCRNRSLLHFLGSASTSAPLSVIQEGPSEWKPLIRTLSFYTPWVTTALSMLNWGSVVSETLRLANLSAVWTKNTWALKTKRLLTEVVKKMLRSRYAILVSSSKISVLDVCLN